MKFLIIWSIQVLVATHLLGSPCNAARSFKDYLEVREDHVTAQSADHFPELHRALAYLGGKLDFTQGPEKLMREILKVSENKWGNKLEPYWRIFEELNERPKLVAEQNCPDWFITDLKYIVRSLDDIVFAPFKELLEFYAPPKLLYCAVRAEDSFANYEAYTRTHIPLIVAFRGASGLKEDAKLLNYLQLLELPLSASKVRISLKGMAKAIKKLVPDTGSKTKQVGDFLDKKCEKLRSDRKLLLTLDTLVLVNAFGDRFTLQPSTQIFLELNRVCSAWIKPDIREATLRALKR